MSNLYFIDQILKQLDNLRKGAQLRSYSASENETISAYLSGDGSVIQVKSLLFKNNKSENFDHKLADKIALMCKEDHLLFSITIRYQLLLREVIGRHMLESFTKKAAILPEELFLIHEEGAEEYILYCCTHPNFKYRYTQGIFENHLATREKLDLVYLSYLQIVEKVADRQGDLYDTPVQTFLFPFLAAYLYGRNPVKYHQYRVALIRDIALRQVMAYLNRHPYHEYMKKLNLLVEQYPVKASFLLQSTAEEFKFLKWQFREAIEAFAHVYFSYVLIFTDYQIPELNELFTIQLQPNLGKGVLPVLCNMIYCMSNAMPFVKERPGVVEEIIKIVAHLPERLISRADAYAFAISVTTAYFGAFDHRVFNNYERVASLFGSEEELLQQAIPLADEVCGLEMAAYFWQQGKALDLIGHYEEILLRLLSRQIEANETDKNELLNWIRNTTLPFPSIRAVFTSITYGPTLYFWSTIFEYSTIARRLINYLVLVYETQWLGSLYEFYNGQNYYSKKKITHILDFLHLIESCDGGGGVFTNNLQKLHDDFFAKEIKAQKKARVENKHNEKKASGEGVISQRMFDDKLIGKMQAIVKKFNKLASLDEKYEVFGAKEHRYETTAVLTDKEIQYFEKTNRLVIPEDFAWFLLNVGRGGAGPMHGLYEFQVTEKVRGDFPLVFGQMFCIQKNIEQYEERVASAITNVAENCTAKGMLRICSAGCGIELGIVLKGPARGSLWLIDFCNYTGIFPLESQSEKGIGMEFAEWFENWIDQSIGSIKKGHKGFDVWDFINESLFQQAEFSLKKK